MNIPKHIQEGRLVRETEYMWVTSNNMPPPDNLQIYMLVYSAGH